MTDVTNSVGPNSYVDGFDANHDVEVIYDDQPTRPIKAQEKEKRGNKASNYNGLLYKSGLVAAAGLSILAITSVAQPSETYDDVSSAAASTTTEAQLEAANAGTRTEGERPGALTVESGDIADSTNPATTETTTEATAEETTAPTVVGNADYQSNLDLILASSIRNANHDNSAYINTPSSDLNPQNHYGPRSEYLNNPGDNPEQSFPIPNGGQFRAGCEFSHFSYDDPLVFPGQPGASHLHMHFGNTHVNAFTTADSLINSGSSTCNGQELNRTGYWVPAMFDGQGNVRIPERVVVYYKGEGLARGAAQPYPDDIAIIATKDLNNPNAQTGGGSVGKYSYVCSNNFSAPTSQPASLTMPNCGGNFFKDLYGVDDNPRVVLEMNVKFPQCWNGKDPSNYRNFSEPASGGWYGSNCQGEFNQTFLNLEYFVNYPVALGENTADWYLSSDVDKTTFGTSKAAGGSTVHGDWWGGWHKETNKTWLQNCVNYVNPSGAPSGCGFGYLSDGGSDGANPADGPALKIRPQYTGPTKVPAKTLFTELCPNANRSYNKPEDAAYCTPS